MALLKLDEAAGAYQVHRTTLYRALREHRLQRHEVDGSSNTWLDSDEVARLVRPARLTESELLHIAGNVVDVLYEEFDDVLAASGRPASLEASVERQLARFLNAYNLMPGPDFAVETTAGVTYESREPHYRDRPMLTFHGAASGRKEQDFWTFWMSVRLAPELNALVGDTLGIVATARFTNPAM
jgi:hypothetical protein